MPAPSRSQLQNYTTERLVEAQAEMARLQKEAEMDAPQMAKEEQKAEEVWKAEMMWKVTEKARKHVVEESLEVEEVEGLKKKKLNKGKGKVVDEEEGEEKKPIVLVATSVTCNQCRKAGASCMYQQGGKTCSCHSCLEVLWDAQADIREFQNSFLFLQQDRDHLAEHQATLDAYLDQLWEKISEVKVGNEEFTADLSEPEVEAELSRGLAEQKGDAVAGEGKAVEGREGMVDSEGKGDEGTRVVADSEGTGAV
ncbi:hypothetical protein BV20DRAFT_1056310 [Pilatotrama ljubarskyi]|nr:hypothetical protein BV20DRAFT_1056310 [Pilatotrama ljubarskyi]